MCVFVCVCVYFFISFVVSLYTAVCTQFSQTHRMHPAAAAAAAAAWVGVQVIHTYLDVILKVILGLARRTSQAGSVELCWSAAMHQLAHTVGVTQLIYVDLSTLWRLGLQPPLFGLLGRAGLSSRVCFHKWDNRED